MNNLKNWLSAFRLRTLPLSLSGIILAAFLAIQNNVFDSAILILAIFTTLSLQILSNLANDYGDGVKGTDNEDRIGPKRAIQSGHISPSSMFKAIKINVVITIVFAALLIYAAFGLSYVVYSIIFFVLGGLAIYAAIRYTVGDNAYGYKGLGDVFVFLFFGLVSIIGSYVLFAKQIDPVVFLPACTIGFLSTAVLNLNNLRDYESDKKSNKNTLIVKIGIKNGKIYHYFLIIAAIVLSASFGILYYSSPYNFIYVIAYIPLLIHLKTVYKTKDTKQLDPELKKVALTTFVLSILLGIGHIL